MPKDESKTFLGEKIPQSTLTSLKKKISANGNLNSYRSTHSGTRSNSSLSINKESQKLSKIMQNTSEAMKTNRTHIQQNGDENQIRLKRKEGSGSESHRILKRNISQEMKQLKENVDKLKIKKKSSKNDFKS